MYNDKKAFVRKENIKLAQQLHYKAPEIKFVHSSQIGIIALPHGFHMVYGVTTQDLKLNNPQIKALLALTNNYPARFAQVIFGIFFLEIFLIFTLFNFLPPLIHSAVLATMWVADFFGIVPLLKQLRYQHDNKVSKIINFRTLDRVILLIDTNNNYHYNLQEIVGSNPIIIFEARAFRRMINNITPVSERAKKFREENL